MKRIFQVMFLILLTACVVYTAVSSRHNGTGTCRHEWELGYEKTIPAAGKDSTPLAVASEK